ncbi:MAG: DUF167 domain-containing protein [Candidatus Burarchaeum sp.]|nr:DUF167 domain-containing protein [Candidatus Burarchaeum sp.]MDO8339183.1 DUF167 domain-containing protein [Candidatus Burarchaeum sp.]
MIIDAVVKPSSRKFEAKLGQGEGGKPLLRVSLTEPAEKNKANLELLKELSRLLGCEVRLVAGAKSKKKKLELAIDEASFYAKLQNHK